MMRKTRKVSIYEIEDVKAAINALNALEQKTSVRFNGTLSVVNTADGDGALDLVVPVRWDNDMYVIEWRL